MKKLSIIVIAILTTVFNASSQSLVNVKSKKFKTTSGIKIEGQVGFLEVPENRNNPNSRKIKLKYVHLKSISDNPATPVIYLEGGGGQITWEASNPKYLNDRLEYLEVADLIFLDRRGSNDRALTYIWKGEYPQDFFVSEEKANQHFQKVVGVALTSFEDKDVDVKGYTIEEHAIDVNDLMTLLGFNTYTFFGFSYGTHIGMTVMQLFPESVERAILVGADAPNQALNFPSHLDKHIKTISEMVAKDSSINQAIPDFESLVYETMKKLDANPVTVTVKNPLTRKEMDLKIGGFGLGLILRLDIDDANDIPVIPRLLYSINNGDYSILTWFVQQRMTLAMGIPGQGINQQLASGVSAARWSQIEKEAEKSQFGNAVNFPFSAVKDHWINNELSFDSTEPLKSDIPTLFITGTLDARTPVEQVEETMKGFTNAIHIEVENAGHEQAQWDGDVANKIIPTFMQNGTVEIFEAYYSDIDFIKLTGEATGHPSIK